MNLALKSLERLGSKEKENGGPAQTEESDAELIDSSEEDDSI